jgi:hypothetical protein
MRVLLVLLFCGLPIPLSAQTALQTFISPEGAFRFKHSKLLVRCTEQRHEEGYPGWWVPAESCESYSPVCDDPGQQGSRTLVCFAYPKAKFRDYPTFGAATFSVAEIKRVVFEKECLAGSPDWVIDPRGSGKTVNINLVKFKVFETDGVGTGHGIDGHVYRTYHRDTCYELSIRIAVTGSWVFGEPVKELTQKNWNEVNSRLEEALYSFRFSK